MAAEADVTAVMAPLRTLVIAIALFFGVLGAAFAGPALHHEEPHQLSAVSAVSDLSSRLAARTQDARLPLPSPQELEAIKKVAQILVMLGEQVIPAIIGEPAAPAAAAPVSGCEPPVGVVDAGLDPVADKSAQTS